MFRKKEKGKVSAVRLREHCVEESGRDRFIDKYISQPCKGEGASS